MGFDPDARYLLAAASGVAVMAAGGLTMRLPPGTRAGRWFGLFAIVWGASVLLANLGQMETEVAVLPLWILANSVLLILVPVPLVMFSQALSGGRSGGGRAVMTGVVTACGVVLLVLILRPAWFIGTVAGDGFTPGPAAPFLGAVSNILLFGAVVPGLARGYLDDPEDRRPVYGILLAAVLAYVSYRGTELLTDALLDPTLFAGSELPVTLLGVLLVLETLAVLGWILARPPAAWKILIVMSATIPTAFAAVESLLGAPLLTLGLWRLAMVALFAYAIARYKLFDLELKLRNLAPGAAYAVAVLVGVGLLAAFFGARLWQAPVFAAVALAGVGLVAVPSVRLTREILDRRVGYVGDEDYLYKRKVDVYRAALEEAHARGASEQTEQLFLSDLRRRLGITDAEHRILLLVLQGQAKYERPATVAQKFRIERELGRGSFGRALLAHDLALDRKVVLKQPIAAWIMDADGRKAFVQEARLAARVKHPNVVTIHAVLEEDPPVLVMEHVAGGSLEDLLMHGPLPRDSALRIARDVARGVAAVHAAGIVHRDLKPANVLLDADGTAKVTDFGVARPPEDVARTATAVAGFQPGSVAYMSPEQARGGDVDARTDVYAMGAILYRMLAGAHYLDLAGASEFRARALVQEVEPVYPATLPDDIVAVLRRALAKSVADRYASASQFLAALPSS